MGHWVEVGDIALLYLIMKRRKKYESKMTVATDKLVYEMGR